MAFSPRDDKLAILEFNVGNVIIIQVVFAYSTTHVHLGGHDRSPFVERPEDGIGRCRVFFRIANTGTIFYVEVLKKVRNVRHAEEEQTGVDNTFVRNFPASLADIALQEIRGGEYIS